MSSYILTIAGLTLGCLMMWIGNVGACDPDVCPRYAYIQAIFGCLMVLGWTVVLVVKLFGLV